MGRNWGRRSGSFAGECEGEDRIALGVAEQRVSAGGDHDEFGASILYIRRNHACSCACVCAWPRDARSLTNTPTRIDTGAGGKQVSEKRARAKRSTLTSTSAMPIAS